MHLIIVTAQINFHVMSEVCCAYELLASYCFPSTGEFCGLFFFCLLKIHILRLMHVISATQETEIGRIMV
jgi:hypothetical protein